MLKSKLFLYGGETEMTDLALPKTGATEKYCFECGAVIRAKAEICPKCGVRQPMASGRGKNKVVAGLLAILLGGVGIHKFYLGKIGQGVLYLIFCWTFIPALIGFFEGIIYLATSDENFERKYG
jgi:TM2 domain-containing membrane protein YozV